MNRFKALGESSSDSAFSRRTNTRDASSQKDKPFTEKNKSKMKPFQTMPCRVKSYEAALNGYEKTDTYLIAYNDICKYLIKSMKKKL